MQQQQGVAPVMVYGIPMQDPDAASKVQRVLVCSGITALCSVIYYGWLLIASGSFQVLISLLLALLVPACGYFGAKNKNKGLVCAFWGCNLLSCIGFACMGILLVFVLAIFSQWIKILQPFSKCCTEVEACGFGDGCTCTYQYAGATLYFGAGDECSGGGGSLSSGADFHSAMMTSTGADGDCSCCTGQNPNGGFCTPTYQGPASSKAACSSLYPAACSTCDGSGGSGSCTYFSGTSDNTCTKDAPCCLAKDSCDSFKSFAPYVGDLSGDTIYLLAIIPFIFAIPSCLACWFGYSLYNSPTYFIAAPMISAYMAAPMGAPVPTQPGYGVQQQSKPPGSW